MKERVSVPDLDGATIVNPRGITFQVIPMDQCIGLAESLQSQSRPWHSHAIWPGCLESPYPNFAVVIEDPVSGRSFISPSESFPEVDKVLVRMLHGDAILNPVREKGASDAPVESKVLDVVRAAVARGADWHHHMCFPDCVFNPEPGKWTISVESEDQTSSESWDQEPFDVLWELEILCFYPNNER
jgi:hypothetical protein